MGYVRRCLAGHGVIPGRKRAARTRYIEGGSLCAHDADSALVAFGREMLANFPSDGALISFISILPNNGAYLLSVFHHGLMQVTPEELADPKVGRDREQNE